MVNSNIMQNMLDESVPNKGWLDYTTEFKHIIKNAKFQIILEDDTNFPILKKK